MHPAGAARDREFRETAAASQGIGIVAACYYIIMVNTHMKQLDEIECPKCGTFIPVSEALRHQLTQHIRQELEEKVGRREEELLAKEKELKDKAERLAGEEKQVETRVAEEVASALASREAELKKREDAIAAERKAFETRLQEALSHERTKLEAEAKKRAEDALSVEMKDMQERLRENEERLATAEAAELALRKRERELEEREKNAALEAERRIAAERQRVEEETAKRLEEAHRLKDAEKDKKLQDAAKVNEELRRKLQQGSQQTQGEVLELQIEELIGSAFPGDAIEPVPKGVNGADVIHRICNRRGDKCGVIVWEVKHTKAWSDSWYQKLKDDLRLVKGDVAVLVTGVLPKGVEHFAHVNGVWVTTPSCALGLATALRGQLIEVATTKLAAVGKNEKMEVLYQYLSGSEFRQRVEAIVEAFVDMEKDLRAERRAAERQWSKREKQIGRMMANTAGMYGDLQGIIGTSLRTIPTLTAGEEDAIEEASLAIPDDDEDEFGPGNIPPSLLTATA